MKRVYLDNAATTALLPEVLEEMKPYLLEAYGNPSSAHFIGREARAAVEKSRKTIAQLIGAKPARLLFTSGATESNNLVFKFAKKDLNIETVISSPLEHHSVLYTAKRLFGDNVLYCRHHEDGMLDLTHLEQLVEQNPNSLVSIMHANNEVGTIHPIQRIAEICHLHKCLLHSDTVQSIVHQQLNIEALGLDFAVCSAHKFHGPKGTGFLAFGRDFKLSADQFGGAQEKGLRAGTENVASIVGMAKALEITVGNLAKNEAHFALLKSELISLLRKIEGVKFNANSNNTAGILASILNISLPLERFSEMTLFQLDLKGIALSGGSACGSGAVKGSHVLTFLNKDEENISLRISFSPFTSSEDLVYFVDALLEISE